MDIKQLSLFYDDENEKSDDSLYFDDKLEINHGDIYLLGGKHYLLCGDATNKDNISILTNGVNINLLVTDPPHNVAYEGKTGDKLTIMNDKMNDLEFRLFLKKAFDAANSVMVQGSSFYIFHADSEGYNFRGACRDVNWTVRQCLIWKKDTFIMGRQDYHWQHEPILYGWIDGASHNWYSDRKQTTILEFPKPLKSELHPTTKPIDLYMYLISNSSKQGDNVLDTFAGSGTLVLACEYLKRNAYMVELDPKYCNVIISRYKRIFNGSIEFIKNIHGV